VEEPGSRASPRRELIPGKGAIHVTRGLTDDPSAWPLLVSWRWKWPMGLLIVSVTFSLYGVTNHYPLSEPVLLPLTELEQRIPFLPWTVWIYWSGILMIPSVFWMNRCIVSLNKHLYSFLVTVFLACAFFAVYPTTYPRELYPLPAGLDPYTLAAFEFLRRMDSPANCLPSLHVALPFVIAPGFLEDRLYHPWPFLLIFSWSVLLAASTLTTKQHYLWDVLGGVLLAAGVYALVHLKARFRRPF
jgi:membrane-associated phospholipid phosphatase